MKVVENNELDKVKGGEVMTAVWIGLAVTAIVIFISGVIEGQIKLK